MGVRASGLVGPGPRNLAGWLVWVCVPRIPGWGQSRDAGTFPGAALSTGPGRGRDVAGTQLSLAGWSCWSVSDPVA